MRTRPIVPLFLLLLLANAQGNEQPCSSTLLTQGRAGICVYDVGRKPLFVSIRVVLDGEVRGKLAKQQPWLWVDADPGAHVIGVDLGKSPQARRKVQAAAGEIKYLRYERVIQTTIGFLDTTSAAQADLLEVAAADAAGDLDRLAAPLSKRSRR